MPYLPDLAVPNERCQDGCTRGGILEIRGPRKGISQAYWDAIPEGQRVYHCSHCGLVWRKNPRSKTGAVHVGIWNPRTGTLKPS